MIPRLHRLTWWLIGFVFTLLAGLGLALPAEAAGPTLSPQKCSFEWTAPTTNTDGTPLMDLAGYNIYVGNAPGQFTTVFKQLSAPAPAPPANFTVTWDCTAEPITDGQHFLQLRARDLVGNLSDLATPAAGETWVKADGVPFVFDAKSPAGASGLRPKP